jgi:hypothetical protein
MRIRIAFVLLGGMALKAACTVVKSPEPSCVTVRRFLWDVWASKDPAKKMLKRKIFFMFHFLNHAKPQKCKEFKDKLMPLFKL